MTEALRMLDVPRDIPEQETPVRPAKKEKIYDDVSIADLGGTSIMEEDPSVKQLLAEQAQILPPTAANADIPPAPSMALALPAPRPEAAPAAPEPTTPVVPQGPLVPDFRGKSMRDAMEAASERGIEVTVEGSGMARAQMPLPGTPLHQGDRIRIIFTR
jgi:cell division protein FtsI (penicillin-binding protein 3)